MASKPKPVYEDFEVHTEWVHEVADDTLIAHLPGFRKEQIKVQVTSTRNLRISGKRTIGGNKFSRFFKEIPIPSNCDQNNIKATFKDGLLSVKHPKLIDPTEFEVHTEWVHEVADDTLIAHLPGFRKEQIKVQVTSTRNLRISGERPIGDNKLSRFFKEIPIPSNCDKNNIKASFKDGLLCVRHPKLIEPQPAKPSAKSDQKPAPQPPRPADVPQKQKNGVEEAPPKATKEADTASEKAPDKEKERKDESNVAAAESDKPIEKEEKDWDQKEKLGDSVQDAEPEKRHGIDKYQIAINMAWVKYKQVLDGLAKGNKNPRTMMNTALVVLLAVVLAVYLRNAIRSPGN